MTDFYGAGDETELFEKLELLNGLSEVRENFTLEDKEYVMHLRDYYRKYPDKEQRIEKAAKELLNLLKKPEPQLSA